MVILYEGLSLDVPADVPLDVSCIDEIPRVFINPETLNCWKRPFARDLGDRMSIIVDTHLGGDGRKDVSPNGISETFNRNKKMVKMLANAYDVAVSGVAESGILESGQNQVRIFTPAELPTDWDPDADDRLTVWEVVHHLIRILESEGESAASKILGRRSIQSNDLAENAKALAYRLFTICEEKKWAELGKSYNGLVIAWPELEKLANDSEKPTLTQADLI